MKEQNKEGVGGEILTCNRSPANLSLKEVYENSCTLSFILLSMIYDVNLYQLKHLKTFKR